MGKEEHTALRGNQAVSPSQARQAMHTALSQTTTDLKPFAIPVYLIPRHYVSPPVAQELEKLTVMAVSL